MASGAVTRSEQSRARADIAFASTSHSLGSSGSGSVQSQHGIPSCHDVTHTRHGCHLLLTRSSVKTGTGSRVFETIASVYSTGPGHQMMPSRASNDARDPRPRNRPFQRACIDKSLSRCLRMKRFLPFCPLASVCGTFTKRSLRVQFPCTSRKVLGEFIFCWGCSGLVDGGLQRGPHSVTDPSESTTNRSTPTP